VTRAKVGGEAARETVPNEAYKVCAVLCFIYLITYYGGFATCLQIHWLVPSVGRVFSFWLIISSGSVSIHTNLFSIRERSQICVIRIPSVKESPVLNISIPSTKDLPVMGLRIPSVKYPAVLNPLNRRLTGILERNPR
jgi:hypothetical protein